MEEEIDNLSLLPGFINKEYRPRIGYRWEYAYLNGYGASVVKEIAGLHKGQYEIAILCDGNTNICYDTDITDDVISGIDTWEDVSKYLELIKNLKRRKEVNKKLC